MSQVQDYEIAKDLADTIIHYRQSGSFPTTELIKEFISTEVKIKSNINKIQVALITEDMVREADEWYDKECEPQ